MLNYREDFEASKDFKIKYRDGIELLIEKRQKEAEEKRKIYFSEIFSDQERYREDLSKMLGWPLVDCEAVGVPRVDYCEKLTEEESHEVYRMSFEVLDGFFMTGLFYKLKNEGKNPLVIVQHGGMGSPEHIAGFEGSTTNYNDMLERVIKQGVHAFAPQLLLWRDAYEVKYDRVNLDARLKRVGSSISAVELYGIRRILDYFEEQPCVSTLGMLGLSYGGFYTLFTAALDTRIKAAVSCSFFNNRDSIGWSDWVWHNSAELFDDAEVACLVYPRKLDIQIGEKDPGFSFKGGEKSYKRVLEICKNVGTDWLNFNVFDGTHELFKEDGPIEKFAEELKK